MKTFKNLLCFILIAMGWLQADMLDNFTKAINSYTTKKLNEIKDQANSANPTKNRNTAYNANGMLTNIDCKVLKNNFYSVCYSSELKNPIYGVSVLFGDLVDKNNIEKRLKRTHDWPNTNKLRHKITPEAVLIGGILWRMTLLLILRLTL